MYRKGALAQNSFSHYSSSSSDFLSAFRSHKAVLQKGKKRTGMVPRMNCTIFQVNYFKTLNLKDTNIFKIASDLNIHHLQLKYTKMSGQSLKVNE